ncbi:glycoside hydrolase [Butyriboletus roseoflavus]|nr:glycoside hydrolase [Butyriboletus roseoflavus]
MPQVPKTCPATGQPTPKDYLYTLNGQFVDTTGRTLLLRGVNLSGSTKAPVGQPSHVLDGFWSSAQAGGQRFLGRPFDIDDGSADAHLGRLRGWGFNVLRYPIPWEALEHEGPGRFDYDFMDYTIRVLHKCKEYGFKVYVDPHQDIWSRFSGGSGAPYWTLPACGIDPEAFTATQAAIVHCEYANPSSDTPDPAALPSMIWSTNYSRLASQTLFALFFGGKVYTPKCIIDGMNIQDYLQSHFIKAFGILADRIRDAGGLLDDVVIGWDNMNEPSEGFIGYEDLSVYPTVQGSALKKGTMPTPLQSFTLGMGVAQVLDNYTFGSFGSTRSGSVVVDPKGVRIWADPSTEPDGVHPKWGWQRSSEWTLGTCVWALHGVWDHRSGSLLRPDYFRYNPSPSGATGVPVNFLKDFFLPHLTDYVTRIRTAHPSAIAFVQAPVFAIPPAIPESLLQGRGCHSTHYYDGLTLITCHWNFVNADALGVVRGKYSSPIFAAKFGDRAIRASFQSQLGMLKSDGVQLGVDAPGPRRYPTMIGEIGTPMDMDNKNAYDPKSKGYGDYSAQERALDASLNAADGPNALSYTVWTYCPDNSHMWGDGWNNEDLSLWSEDDAGKCGHYDGAAGSLASARASSASLATLPVPSSPYVSTSPSLTVKSVPLHEVLAFLRDGARAIRAFCRPYPVKVVGTPVDIQFDIRKASLKVKVRVTPADAPQTETEGEGGEGLVKDEDNKHESMLPTEIFIPLVHFASDECVERSVAVRAREERAELDPDAVRSGSRSTDTLPLATSTLLGSGREKIETDGYAMEVRVSEGRVEMDDGEQMLRWFYDVPVGGEKEVSIEVTRVGGAIDWARVTRRAARAGGGGSTRKRGITKWVERLCAGGCLIM